MKNELEMLKADLAATYITSTPYILVDRFGTPFSPVFVDGKTTGEIVLNKNPLKVTGFSKVNAEHLARNAAGVRVVGRCDAIRARIAKLESIKSA